MEQLAKDLVLETEIQPNDVLWGRGAPISEHEGNQRLRAMVLQRHTDYVTAAGMAAKHQVAMDIVSQIHQQGGRFLKRTSSVVATKNAANTKPVVVWEITHGKEIVRKVKQLLRDMKPEARQRRAERKRVSQKQDMETAVTSNPRGNDVPNDTSLELLLSNEPNRLLTLKNDSTTKESVASVAPSRGLLHQGPLFGTAESSNESSRKPMSLTSPNEQSHQCQTSVLPSDAATGRPIPPSVDSIRVPLHTASEGALWSLLGANPLMHRQECPPFFVGGSSFLGHTNSTNVTMPQHRTTDVSSLRSDILSSLALPMNASPTTLSLAEALSNRSPVSLTAPSQIPQDLLNTLYRFSSSSATASAGPRTAGQAPLMLPFQFTNQSRTRGFPALEFGGQVGLHNLPFNDSSVNLLGSLSSGSSFQGSTPSDYPGLSTMIPSSDESQTRQDTTAPNESLRKELARLLHSKPAPR